MSAPSFRLTLIGLYDRIRIRIKQLYSEVTMKNNKVLFLTITILIFTLFLPSCSYPSHKDYYSIDDYNNIWSLAGFNHGYEDTGRFFPDNPNNQTVIYFLCRYDQQLPLGEGMQLCLEIQFGDVAFENETKRLSEMSYDATDLFDTHCSVYATRILIEDTYEYALINFQKNTITYIYIQNLPKEEIEFNHDFLPKEYYRYSEMIKSTNKDT